MRLGGSLVIAVLLLTTSSGCGTMANLAGQEVWLIGPAPEREIAPFGGVDNDFRWAARGPGAVLPAMIDMPFSFVGDIVTLPWTAYQFFGVDHPRLSLDAPPSNADTR